MRCPLWSCGRCNFEDHHEILSRSLGKCVIQKRGSTRGRKRQNYPQNISVRNIEIGNVEDSSFAGYSTSVDTKDKQSLENEGPSPMKSPRDTIYAIVSLVWPRHVAAALWLVVLIANNAIFVASQPCSPNLCSRHGSCESSADGSTSARQCQCNQGWMGADCSLKVCPRGSAWSDKASGTDNAHGAAECSNKGECDRRTGHCTCDPGFEGEACSRRSCPNKCGNHGRCQSLSYFAAVQDPGEGMVYKYWDVWDASMMYGCNCDTGYSGPSCSLRDCSVGDDPLTGTEEDPDGEQYNEQQEITCKATGGYFTLTYRGFTTKLIPFDASAYDIVHAIQPLPSLYGIYDTAVSIQFSSSETQACTPEGHSWTVEFMHDFGDVPLFVAGVSKLTHSTSGITPSITVDEILRGTKESKVCSGRGLCDETDGVCQCEVEFDTSNGYNKEGRRGDCGYVVTAVTHCPGEIACSGHGVCSGSPTYTCDCSEGWQGADCSIKTCPHGKSWFMRPTAENTAHLTRTECSSMGTCDRITGDCTCVDGFEGAACDRMSCPGTETGTYDKDPTGGEAGAPFASSTPCSGHGQCVSMSMLAEASDKNGVDMDYTYGGIPNDPATWDHDMIQGCLCDEGYEGHSCSLRSCPRGDDPDTHHQYNEVQNIRCLDADEDGQVVFTFREAHTSTLTVTSTEAEMEQALEALSTLIKVAVECDTGVLCNTTQPSLCTVEFLTELGDVPLISASTSNIDQLNITEYQMGTKEYEVCSFKGLCDYATGTCQCFPGYGSSDGQNNVGDLGDCGYILPFAPGLRETDLNRPVGRSWGTSLRGTASGNRLSGISGQEGHVAWHDAMHKALNNIPN